MKFENGVVLYGSQVRHKKRADQKSATKIKSKIIISKMKGMVKYEGHEKTIARITRGNKNFASENISHAKNT